MSEQTTVGSRIRRVRKEKKLSGDEFGAVIGVGRGQVSYIENDKALPTLEGFIKILVAFPDIDGNWLATGKGEMYISERIEKEEGSDCWDMLKAERAKTQTLEDILRKHGILKVE